ncbi:MAG TPA: ATP-binding domain-containing protein, partial [Ruminiclostridium sp.]|nr:ATP-binding domain-containing protein [Ruminiclostridium sp.]
GVIPTVKLNVIKRQADGSGIIYNANRIINGEMPELINANKDFFIVEEEDKNRVIKRTLEALNRLMTGYNYAIDDVQVICPQKTSEIGTYEMNKAIQEMVNPAAKEKAEIKRGNSIFREGDKVIHLNNNYEAVHYHIDPETKRYVAEESSGVFNGDIGRIIQISKIEEIEQAEGEDDTGSNSSIEKKVAVQYDDFIIIYQINELEEIDLAYSLTVHKMQGSQCEAAVILCHMRNYIMLNRNLGYTAVTRARKMACLIGQRRAIAVMVQNVKVTQRNTMLADLLSFKADPLN